MGENVSMGVLSSVDKITSASNDRRKPPPTYTHTHILIAPWASPPPSRTTHIPTHPLAEAVDTVARSILILVRGARVCFSSSLFEEKSHLLIPSALLYLKKNPTF